MNQKPYNLFLTALKHKKMCDKAAKDDSSSLQLVPDWFVTYQQVKIWHNDDDYDDDDARLAQDIK